MTPWLSSPGHPGTVPDRTPLAPAPAMTAMTRPRHHGLFWDSLVASEAFDFELVAELKERWTPESWRPLGEVLLREGYLTMRQLGGLLGMQADEPHMRLGDLAVREGLCSVDAIEAALQLQRRSCPGPIELLLQDRRVDRDDLLDALLVYVRFLEGHVLAGRD